MTASQRHKKILNKRKGNIMIIHGIEIKDGYLLVVKTRGKIHNMTVGNCCINSMGLGCVTPGEHYWPVDKFNADGVYMESQILAIYGRTYNCCLLDNSTKDRELLWERKETKKMTVSEICEALGYDVEIVKEGQA